MTETTEAGALELPRDFASRTSADERALIVAWLRKQTVLKWDLNSDESAALIDAAEAIARGDHACE